MYNHASKMWRRLAVDFFLSVSTLHEYYWYERERERGREKKKKKKEKEERNKNARNNECYRCAVGWRAVLRVWFFEENVRKSSFVSDIYKNVTWQISFAFYLFAIPFIALLLPANQYPKLSSNIVPGPIVRWPPAIIFFFDDNSLKIPLEIIPY